jgi:hypothetical protein
MPHDGPKIKQNMIKHGTIAYVSFVGKEGVPGLWGADPGLGLRMLGR